MTNLAFSPCQRHWVRACSGFRNNLFSTSVCRGHCLQTRRAARGARLTERLCARASAGRNYLQEEHRLKQELLELEEERDTALVRGKAAAAKVLRLTEASQQLLRQAELLVAADDMAAARAHLEDKALVQDALAKAQHRSAANLELASRLDTHIGKKESELIVLLSAVGKITLPHQAPQSTAPPLAGHTRQQHGPMPSTSAPATRSEGSTQQQAKSERDIDKAFLDMERSSLERLLNLESPGPARDEPEPERPRSAPHERDEPASSPVRPEDTMLRNASRSSPSDLQTFPDERAADVPRWWQAGTRWVQQQRQQDSQNPALQNLTRGEAQKAAGRLHELLVDISEWEAGRGNHKGHDVLCALHLARIASVGGQAVELPNIHPSRLSEEFRELAQSCLTSLSQHVGLSAPRGEQQAAVSPATCSFWTDRQLDKPLTPTAAQGVVAECAELLHISPSTAGHFVTSALGDWLAAELPKEACYAEQASADGAGLRLSATTLAQIRQALSAFAPQLGSKDLAYIQAKVDAAHRTQPMSARFRKQLGLEFAKGDSDPELFTTRVLYAVLRLDALE